MTRRDWLLLLLGFKGTGDTVALDPVRVQKGMFLLTYEGGIPASEAYPFKPYHYGPYSFELKHDLNELARSGLAAAHPVPGYTWHRYHLTKSGLDEAREILAVAPHDQAVNVADIKSRITGLSFNSLLREVYADHPEFATNSIFQQ